MKSKVAYLFVVLALAGSALGQGSSEYTRRNPKFLSAFKESVARPSVSTVRIVAGGKDVALGVVVGDDGWILTKAEDLKGVVSVRFAGGKTYDAEVVGVHKAHDLALLKIDARNLIPIEFKASSAAEVGSWIACVGQTETPVAVGVISVATRNLGTYIGVNIEVAPGGGVKILEIGPNTPASKCGMRVGDIVLAIDGKRVDQTEAFSQAISKHSAGELVKVKIRRGAEEIEKTARLETRTPGTSPRGDAQNKMGSQLSARRGGYTTILQHDSVVNPTDCGGPIVDLDGHVIGLNICRAGRVESWAVPSEAILPLLGELKSGKFAPPIAQLQLPPEEKLKRAKSAVERIERDKTLDKEIAEARKALKDVEAEVKTFRKKEAAESVDRLLGLMQKRLAIMNDVAAWKWNHRQESLDSKREDELLAQLHAKAVELKIDPKIVERFFKAQFEAARRLQEERMAAWTREKAEPKTAGDLVKDLRPRIDRMNDEMVEALAKTLRYWGDAETALPERVRQRSAQVLSGPGISDAVRAKALEGLLPP